ncbi:Shikimate 5-dehydrogenase I alpha [Anaerovibrio sp. JC8]|uniref:shikimate dehydrogenase n=1 Tax=Anaerovibrio sp. JC8 TaxID=1240085 RepID=UPI000A0B7CF2|nr:shikimate dehydrogenase [Anaerovibrio sp. JC8]ORU00789.1 Shikimate 5-dehydrogenase I alpha [Anaerovibrio sp. JC8]
MITGKTKTLAVIGNPVAHSLSPVFQNAAIEAAGLDYIYTAFPVADGQLGKAIQGMKAFGICGLNVTIPHKEQVMKHLDHVDKDAEILGAVNTIVNKDGVLTGYNTDVKGFIGGMKQLGYAPKGKHAVLLGAGGAARAVIWGLIQEGVASLTIGVRNVPKVRPLVEYFSKYMEITLLDWQTEDFEMALEKAELLVNATPLGMCPYVEAMPPVNWDRVKPGILVYDIIYTPAETLFLKTAKEHGCKVLNGEAMLVGQGAESLRLWTGIEPDLEIMTKALRRALEERKD